MARHPRVDLLFADNLARHVASGIDPNDAHRLIDRVERWGWEDWCRFWSKEAARHQKLAKEAADKGREVSAAEDRQARDDRDL